MDNDMLGDFYIEAEELFDEAEDSLLAIEKSDNYQSCFNSIFRAFHSVKGAAGMFGIEKLQEHMHFVENLLEKKKSDGSMSSAMVDYLLKAVDGARRILKGETIEFEYRDPDNPQIETPKVDKDIIESIKKGASERARKQNLGGHIFVVDDEEDILEITKTFLKEEEFEVDIFNNAKDALEALKTTTPDLVISDIKMPEMNGVEFMRLAHKQKPHLPFIVVSGYVTKEVCMDALSCGVSGIIEKPFDGDYLISLCNILINRYKNLKLLNKSIDLLIYQFEGFDKYLLENFGETKRDTFRAELKGILKQKKELFENLK